VKIRIRSPHHFYADTDPAFYFDVDASPNPTLFMSVQPSVADTSHFNADTSHFNAEPEAELAFPLMQIRNGFSKMIWIYAESD
jgi:hypothetical protein